MITLIEALDFRCLRYVRQQVGRFHVLVGPNASGKTSFLDVPALLGQLVSEGLDAAIRERTQTFEDLVWRRSGRRIELAIEARIPDELRAALADPELQSIRYEVSLGLHQATYELSILAEKVILKNEGFDFFKDFELDSERYAFPDPPTPPLTILSPKRQDWKTVVNKMPDGNDNFYNEAGKRWAHAFKLGPRRSALGNLPEDETKFPVSAWLKRFLSTGVQQIILNSLIIRKASPPGQIRGFKPDGSNLPWVIEDFKAREPARFSEWVAHLRTALPDLEDILTVERPDDRHRYLVLRYRGGLDVPAWMASDGTLRLLALTLTAYLPAFDGVYLIEEPENGIHPRAVETLCQSLVSVYGAQILLATHSPVILSIVRAEDVLCFAKSDEGATDIVSGDRHPALREWHGETNLSVMFAGGVLG